MERKNLAQQLAETLRDDIINEKYKSGDTLPTEPVLAEMYEVSRSVVRDAVRIVMAWGLIDIKHGKGMYVTENQVRGFSEALTIALKRSKATVWDVVEFEQLLFPKLIGLAAVNHNSSRTPLLRKILDDYLKSIRENKAIKVIMEIAYLLIEEIIISSGNKVAVLLSGPIVRLRNYNVWKDEGSPDIEEILEIEEKIFLPIINALDCHDREAAEKAAEWSVILPPEAVDVMKNTPAGDVPQIPVGLYTAKDYWSENKTGRL